MSRKTHKAAAKRLKVTPKGKIKRRRMGKDHLLTCKNSKRRRRLRRPAIVGGRAAKRLAGFIKP